MARLAGLLAALVVVRASALSRPSRHAVRRVATPVAEEDAPPLSDFAAKVEGKIRQRFGDQVGRVIESWRLADRGYEHAEDLDDPHPYMRQEARSYLPGLAVRCFYDVSEVGWARHLEEHWEVVRDEFAAVALRDADRLSAVGNNVWASAADAGSAASYGPDWKTLVLMDRTTWDPTNAVLFPKTAALLEAAGVPCVEAFFASMQPRSKINAHSDSCNFVLTSHLGLVIPPACRLTVGNETRPWKNGEVSLFDTSLLHDAVNDSDETRYILMLRVWHPDLTDAERRALQYLFDILDVPDLLSDDATRVFQADAHLSHLRTRPTRQNTHAAASSASPSNKEAPKKKKNRSSGSPRGFGVSKR